jgi:hypothetical protein
MEKISSSLKHDVLMIKPKGFKKKIKKFYFLLTLIWLHHFSFEEDSHHQFVA